MRFSALQRAEIAEIDRDALLREVAAPVSVLFNEPKLLKSNMHPIISVLSARFSALQRAEIAEIGDNPGFAVEVKAVSVLFNEPKLLKFSLLLSV